ncbi:hypothetical protein GCM10010302_33760 [Streptomyces polychromogenes]|uniref:Uncharacterized protein n=1 Tax=Streptomyces polychromogenes TaxID=67342 RepID=A0ABP3F1J2_9ACTN
MTNTPAAFVGPPDDIGLRKVVIDGKTAGTVRNLNELGKVLRQAGLGLEDGVEWRGGDSTVWPDRTWLRRVTGVLMAVGLLGTASVLVKIGAKDAVDALTFAGRMAGFVLLAAGVVEAFCVLAAFDYWGRRRAAQSGPVLLLGASIALLASLGLLLLHVLNGSFPWYVLIWTALALWSFWALWVLVVRGRVWKRLHNPRHIAIGATVSTLLVVTNLAYGSVYVPSVAYPLVESTAAFGTPSLDKKGKMYLRVRLQIKNVGQVPVYVLGSIYWIKYRLANEGYPRYQVMSPGEFIDPPGRTLNPKEDYSVDVVAEIEHPETLTHEAVKVDTETFVVRKDRLEVAGDYEGSGKWKSELVKQGKEKDPPGPADNYKRYQSGISQSSELMNVVRGRERVTVWWVHSPYDPHLYVNVSRPGEDKTFEHGVGHAADRYGLALVRGSVAETPFPELLKKAQGQRPS